MQRRTAVSLLLLTAFRDGSALYKIRSSGSGAPSVVRQDLQHQLSLATTPINGPRSSRSGPGAALPRDPPPPVVRHPAGVILPSFHHVSQCDVPPAGVDRTACQANDDVRLTQPANSTAKTEKHGYRAGATTGEPLTEPPTPTEPRPVRPSDPRPRSAGRHSPTRLGATLCPHGLVQTRESRSVCHSVRETDSKRHTAYTAAAAHAV